MPRRFDQISPEELYEMREAARVAEINRINRDPWQGAFPTSPLAFVFEVSAVHLGMALEDLQQIVTMRCKYLNITPESILWRHNGRNIGSSKFPFGTKH
jgi:hypothetical protein